jgi:putative oxidoreductase
MHRLYGEFLGGRAALGLLLLRVVAGVAMVIHGWSKVQNPTGWMGPDGPPGILQALAALGEFGGGLGLLFGCLTLPACFGIACVMLGAIFTAHRGAPWINPGGKSFELASLYLLIAAVVAIIGPGLHSLDARLFGRQR